MTPHLGLRSRLGGRSPLPLQDPGPVELDERVQFLDQLDRVFVEGRATDFHARRRAEPIENPGPRFPAAPLAVYYVGVLVATLVAVEPQVWQDLLPFLAGPLARA